MGGKRAHLRLCCYAVLDNAPARDIQLLREGEELFRHSYHSRGSGPIVIANNYAVKQMTARGSVSDSDMVDTLSIEMVCATDMLRGRRILHIRQSSDSSLSSRGVQPGKQIFFKITNMGIELGKGLTRRYRRLNSLRPF